MNICATLQMITFEATSELRQDNERLRLAIAGARETAARAEEQAARLRWGFDTALVHAIPAIVRGHVKYHSAPLPSTSVTWASCTHSVACQVWQAANMAPPLQGRELACGSLHVREGA